MKKTENIRLTTRKVILLVIAFLLIGGVFRYLKYEKAREKAFNMTSETDTFLGYILRKDNKPYIVRCDKTLKERLPDYKDYSKQVNILYHVQTSPDDLPTQEEFDNKIDKIDSVVFDEAIEEDESIVFPALINGGGKREYFLYSISDLAEVKSLFNKLQRAFPDYRFKIYTKDDPNWTYYQSYCKQRQFPKDALINM